MRALYCKEALYLCDFLGARPDFLSPSGSVHCSNHILFILWMYNFKPNTIVTSSLTGLYQLVYTGILPFPDCGDFVASLVAGVFSFMVEGRVGSVKG